MSDKNKTYKFKDEFISYLKKDAVLIAKIAKVLGVSTATVSRNYLYDEDPNKMLLRLDALETIQTHLENSTEFKVSSIYDILHIC